jgi:hypothetical protein
MKKNIYIIELIFNNKKYDLMETDRTEIAYKLNNIIPNEYIKSPILKNDINGLYCGSCKKIKDNVKYTITRHRFIEYVKNNVNIGCVNQSLISI